MVKIERLTSEQREEILELLKQGYLENVILDVVGTTPEQVALEGPSFLAQMKHAFNVGTDRKDARAWEVAEQYPTLMLGLLKSRDARYHERSGIRIGIHTAGGPLMVFLAGLGDDEDEDDDCGGPTINGHAEDVTVRRVTDEPPSHPVGRPTPSRAGDPSAGQDDPLDDAPEGAVDAQETGRPVSRSQTYLREGLDGSLETAERIEKRILQLRAREDAGEQDDHPAGADWKVAIPISQSHGARMNIYYSIPPSKRTPARTGLGTFSRRTIFESIFQRLNNLVE